MTVFIEHNANEVSIILYDMICPVNSKYLYKKEQYVDNDEEILTLEKMRTSEIRSQYRCKTGSDWLPG